jgi:hypothetical protein
MARKKYIKYLKTILPLFLGVFFVYLSYLHSTPQERQALYDNILEAKIGYVLLSVSFGVLSHASRAYRWKFLIEPLGYKLPFKLSFPAVMSGYLANLGVPRSGEVLRAATVASYKKIPFETSLGTIISERVADLIMLFLVVSFTFILQSEQLIFLFNRFEINPFIGLLALGILIGGGILFLRIIKRTKNKWLSKLRDFGQGILLGMKSILKMEKRWWFLFHTIFIWIMYISMFFVMKYAIYGAENIPANVIMLAFVVGSFAITLSNGGIGIYPIAIGSAMLLYGIPRETGEAFGWVLWGSQTLVNIILGSLSLFLLPIFQNKD